VLFSTKMFEPIFDLISEYFLQERYSAEFQSAREEYFYKTGKVFEDEPLFESRMASCFEWYLIDRCLWDTGIPPVRLYRLAFGKNLREEDQKALLSFEESTHSIFSFVKRKGSQVFLKECLSGKEFIVFDDQQPSIQEGDILDARLIYLGGKNVLTESMWVHPREALSFIKKEVKSKTFQNKEMYTAFLFDLAYMKLKKDRFSHVPFDQIYNWETLRKDKVEA